METFILTFVVVFAFLLARFRFCIPSSVLTFAICDLDVRFPVWVFVSHFLPKPFVFRILNCILVLFSLRGLVF